MARSWAVGLVELQHAARRFHHVLQRRQVREELEVLKDHAEQPPHLAGLAAGVMAAIGQQRVRADADLALRRTCSGR